MRRPLAFLALLLGLSPSPANAARDCPPYRQDLPLRCAWAYLHLAPAGLLVPLREVHNTSAESPRLGYAFGVGGGFFRTFSYFGVAAGLRFGYGFTRQRFTTYHSEQTYLHVGPELRLGVAPTDRFFVYGLLRGGYSQWRLDNPPRTSIDLGEWRGAHVGGGGGLWGRLGARYLLGLEITFDRLIDGYRGDRPATFSLALGAWL